MFDRIIRMLFLKLDYIPKRRFSVITSNNKNAQSEDVIYFIMKEITRNINISLI